MAEGPSCTDRCSNAERGSLGTGYVPRLRLCIRPQREGIAYLKRANPACGIWPRGEAGAGVGAQEWLDRDDPRIRVKDKKPQDRGVGVAQDVLELPLHGCLVVALERVDEWRRLPGRWAYRGIADDA